MSAIKIYVVISDPDFYRQYETVFRDLKNAKQYILEAEWEQRVEVGSHLWGREFFDRGRWVEETLSYAGAELVTLCWGYPGYGNSYGIFAEEVSSEDGD